MMQTKVFEKYFFFGLLLATILFTLLIFRPFWVVLVLGVSFSIVFYPLYEWLTKKRLPKWLASLLTVLLFTIILCGPLLGIGALVLKQSQNVYQQVVNNGNAKPILDSVNLAVNKILPASIVFDINDKLANFVLYVSNNITNIFSATISAFFSFTLMLLIIFYFLKDGSKWKKAIIVLSPLGDKDDKKIMDRLTFSVNAVIRGYLLIALIQGILMGLGLWVFDVANPALWGVVTAITSLIPTVGTALVSVPAIIFLFISGNTASAIGLMIWAIIVVGMIDNLLYPLIVGESIKIPPLLILFAVLGGLSLLGPIGILVGPLTVSLLYTLISIYRNEFKQNATQSNTLL